MVLTEARDIAQEVADRLVGISAGDMRVLRGVDGCVAFMCCMEFCEPGLLYQTSSLHRLPFVTPLEVPLLCPLTLLGMPSSSTGGHMVRVEYWFFELGVPSNFAKWRR